MEVLLSYGVRDGKIVHISEVSKDEKGKKCNCFCPECGKALSARLGRGVERGGRQPHFAHMPGQECNTLHAQQTAVHMLAKEILAENNEILLPGWEIKREDVMPKEWDYYDFSSVEIELPSPVPAERYEYNSVEIEKYYPGIRADAVIKIQDHDCAVEIAVTHFVDAIKEDKTVNLNLPMFEIDLKNYTEASDREKITEAVLFAENNRKWIYNKKKAEALNKARAEFKDKAEMLTIERKAKEEEQKRQDEKRLADLRARFEPEYYSKVITGLRNEQEAAVWLKTLDFSDKLDEYPFYMDIPIKGEFVFPCDRRIWQSKLFETYVYTRFGHQLFRFNTKNIIDHIEQGKTGLIIDRSIEHYRVVLEEVIKKYFFYLQLLGFVTHNGITFFSNDTWYSESPVFLFPRDRVMADKLKNILATVDPCAPNINEVIFAKLFP